MGDEEVEVPAVDVALADQLGLVGLPDGGLQALALMDVLAADVDVAGVGPDSVAGDQGALDQEVRVVPKDLAVLAGARLGLVGVDDEVVRALALGLGHEGPLQTGGEARPAPAAQA